MCSNPPTKIDPKTGEEVTYACRRCDECIATRRHGWVMRAMAERSMHSYTSSVTLTYGDDTEEGRDGARMFCYADVQAFMARLRRAAAYEAKKQKWNVTPTVRFLCAGEQGDRNGRCHWHLILFTNFDIHRLGKIRRRGHLVTHRREMISVGKVKRRLHWSLWAKNDQPLGFVTFQEPNEGGVAYVLSYCMKDQFTHEKSEGTMRETKSENFATGLFRMSKRPAIGEAWLMQKMERLEAAGAVLPSTQLRIPDASGYYHPNGTFREKLLWSLVAINRRINWATGRDAPQWASLLAACKDSESDMEILLGKEIDPEASSLEYSTDFKGREIEARRLNGDFQRKCGNGLPCEDCLLKFTDDELARIGVQRKWSDDPLPEWNRSRGGFYFENLPGWGNINVARSHRLGFINPYCQKRGSKEARAAFPRSGG